MQVLQVLWDSIKSLALDSGVAGFFEAGGWKNLIMIAVSFFLMYLKPEKKFEPSF